MIERRLRNIIISSHGAKIRKEKNLIKITYRNKKDFSVLRVSPREVEQIIITGEASITSGVVRLLSTHGVDLVFVKHYPHFLARVVRGDQNLITDLWRKQMSLKEERKLELSREFVDCSIYNKIRLLQSLANNRDLKLGHEERSLKGLRDSVKEAKTRESLFGLEGSATRLYWQCIGKIFDHCLGFKRRVKHPPMDPVNSLLSYGYTVLLSRVEYALMIAGLNMYEGLYHKPYRDRSALGFDLMEEFRQPIVDRTVFTLISQSRVSSSDFKLTDEMCVIQDDLKNLYLDALYSRLETKYRYKGSEQEFLDIIFFQAEKLAEAIEQGITYRGFRYR